MKSRYSKKFNHDSMAAGYDKDVKNEDHPIRAGYQSLLNWVQEKTKNSKFIVDLGCGTGNTIKVLQNFEKAYCVDISQKMMDIAKEKLKGRKNIIFLKSDFLGFFPEFKEKQADTIISAYAIHHLIQEEKHKLFEEIYNFLNKGGKLVFGDLMFKNKEQEKEMREKYPDLAEDFDDEFFWHIDDEVKKLESIGFDVEIKRFSDLSWGIYAVK